MWIGIACVDMFGVCALHVYVHVGMSVYGCMWVCTHTCRWARVRACVCACGCACTCMYVDVQVSACGHVQRVYACGHMCEHLCAHACGVSVCGYMWMCTWTCLVCVGIWVHTHAGVHTCVYVGLYVCMRACSVCACMRGCVSRAPCPAPCRPPSCLVLGPLLSGSGVRGLVGALGCPPSHSGTPPPCLAFPAVPQPSPDSTPGGEGPPVGTRRASTRRMGASPCT